MVDDLRGASMEDVARFWFDRPIPSPGATAEWIAECAFQAVPAAEACMQTAWLFSHVPELRRSYSDAQLLHGFKAMGDPWMWDHTSGWLRDGEVPLEQRHAALDAVAKFYRDTSGTPLLAAGWDWLESTWPVLPETPDREAIVGGLLRLLESLLDASDPEAHRAAMDMLGHLREEAGTVALMERRGFALDPAPHGYGKAWIPIRTRAGPEARE